MACSISGQNPTDRALSTNDIVIFHSADFHAQLSSPYNLSAWALRHYGTAHDWRCFCIAQHKLNPP